MAGKTGRIFTTIIIIILIIGGIAYALLHIANKKAEEEARVQLDTTISNNGLTDYVSYENIDIDIASGKVKITQVEFKSPEGVLLLLADELYLDVSTAEVASLAMNPETGTLSRGQFGASNLTLSTMDRSFTTEISSFEIDFNGDLDQRVFEGDISALFQDENSFKIDIDNALLNFDEALIAEFEFFLEGMDFEAFTNELAVKSFTLDLETAPGGLKLNSIAMDSGMLEAAGSGTLILNEMMGIVSAVGQLKVDKISSGLKESISPVLELMGYSIPEGPFNVIFKLPEDGTFELFIN
ncbi:MAG: hypothetical protein JEY99_19610 [Spirochaetales bacterium]|nr:hypothetical protein [Spirochaetales bacterium]